MYKTELHCHSVDVSRCAAADVDSIVSHYLDAGYTTVVLTNHFGDFTFEHHGITNWNDCIDFYYEGYLKLKKAAAGRLHILFGAELRFKGISNDYLLYNVTPDFLKAQEDIFDMKPRIFYPLAQENNILFIQAHPFRDNMMVTPPAYLDGIEVYNGSIVGHYGHDSRNDVAEYWADRFGFLKTSGTDLHFATDPVVGGIMTEEPITSSEQLVDVLRSGKYELIRG